MKKILLLFLLLFLLFSLNAKDSHAQGGTCGCWEDGMGGCMSDGAPNCDAGYSPSQCFRDTNGICSCVCQSSAGYCCHSDADCGQGEVCGSAVGGCSLQGLGECIKIPTPSYKPTDVRCGANRTGINTAIGCIDILSSPEKFISEILKLAFGIGAGLAFIFMLYAGFIIMTASGNPERLKAGHELLTSAIAGLVLLIFSIFILKFIGVDILGLCKFGFGPPC
jgi:hypothetical protein